MPSSLENCSAVRFAAFSDRRSCRGWCPTSSDKSRRSSRRQANCFHVCEALKTLLEHVVDIAHGEGDALALIDDILEVPQIVLDLTPDVFWQLRGVLQHVLVDIDLVLDLLCNCEIWVIWFFTCSADLPTSEINSALLAMLRPFRLPGPSRRRPAHEAAEGRKA